MSGDERGRVVVHRAMSLDGYVAGPEREVDWIFEHYAPGEGAEDIMGSTGAMLSGRHTYDVGQRSTRAETSAAYGAWSGSEFVLTHRARRANDDPEVVFLSGDVADAVVTGLETAAGKNLEVLGTDVTAAVPSRGLVDEVDVHVLPVLLGAGVPLYATCRWRRYDSSLSGRASPARSRSCAIR